MNNISKPYSIIILIALLATIIAFSYHRRKAVETDSTYKDGQVAIKQDVDTPESVITKEAIYIREPLVTSDADVDLVKYSENDERDDSIVAHNNARSTNPLTSDTTSDNEAVSTNDSTEDLSAEKVNGFISIARTTLEQKDVPIEERIANTTVQGDIVIVSFPPKPGARAGDFIVKIDLNTGVVLDTTIWR